MDYISIGYPRYDTCSKCDEFTSQQTIFKKEAEGDERKFDRKA